ncbi:MAG: iron chelate uptake ABC transporter family permease subunit, partial [Peptostreptococcaceae bacterium]
MKKRHLLVILIILSFASIFIGVHDIKMIDIFNLDKEQFKILAISRIPRLMAILVAGMGMSICGLIMQQISRNKFVSPTTGATIDAAQLGLVLSLMLMPNAGMVSKMGMSF